MTFQNKENFKNITKYSNSKNVNKVPESKRNGKHRIPEVTKEVKILKMTFQNKGNFDTKLKIFNKQFYRHLPSGQLSKMNWAISPAESEGLNK